MNLPRRTMMGPIAAFLLVAAANAHGQDPTTLGQGLAGYWKLDEAAGPAIDSSANAFNATWAGGVSGVAPANPAIQFSNPNCALLNGASGVLTVADNPALQIAGDITIALWVNPSGNASDWQRLVGKGCNASFSIRDYGVWREATGGKILWQVWGSGFFLNMTSNDGIPNNAWSHVACTLSGGTATIYINGAASGTQVISGARSVSTDPLTFGYAGIHTYFPGRLDEIRIYTRALAVAEIAMLASGLGGANNRPATPTGLAQFDGASGAPVAAGGPVESALQVRAFVDSPVGENVNLEIEVRPVGTPFINAPTTAGSFTTPGSMAAVNQAGLTPLMSYHWQVRSVDASGRQSAWVSYGTDPDIASEIDFSMAAPYVAAEVSTSVPHPVGCSAGSTAGSSVLLLLLTFAVATALSPRRF